MRDVTGIVIGSCDRARAVDSGRFSALAGVGSAPGDLESGEDTGSRTRKTVVHQVGVDESSRNGAGVVDTLGKGALTRYRPGAGDREGPQCAGGRSYKAAIHSTGGNIRAGHLG